MSQPLKDHARKTLHKDLLYQWMSLVNKGHFEKAVAIDQIHYNELVKKSEDVNYWDRWQRDTVASRKDLTRRFEEIRPTTPFHIKRGSPTLIVHHNFSGLAHETQLARNIDWLRSHGEEINIEIVYLFGGNENNASACSLYSLSPNCVHYLQANSYQEAATKLAQVASSTMANGIIYPTIFFMAFWMSLFVSHPNQKFLQMKYYPLHSGRIKRWAGGYRSSDDYYLINGCKFEQLPILDLEVSNSDFITNYFQTNSISIGSISRPEKISNPDYNRFVLQILKANNKIRYLYAGRFESAEIIPEAIREHPRSVALGWVNPVTVISKFSIYLEPFPWGGGEMTLLALSAGVPYLTLETEESKRFGIYGFLRFLADGQDPVLQTSFCRSKNQLRDRIEQLVDDPEFRSTLGGSWRRVIKSYKPPSLHKWRSFLNE
ncbi:MAG: hypothetical protein VKL39_11020 [Leptolyngbyaceae bacterium]|nr:hypothetical protein [Leptolyngbyaceae bacterium]